MRHKYRLSVEFDANSLESAMETAQAIALDMDGDVLGGPHRVELHQGPIKICTVFADGEVIWATVQRAKGKG